jgi:predicted RNase H-like HicB family nuclease
MKYAYPVLFEYEEGTFQVSVPDLRGCFTFGGTLIDAEEMAWDAMSMWLAKAEEQGEAIPPPSDIKSIQSANGFASIVVADTDEYRRLYDNRSVQKTLTIPAWLDRRAESAGLNCSQIFQEALRQTIGIGA